MSQSLKVLLWDLGSTRNEINEPLGIEILAASVKKKYKDMHVDFKWAYCKNNDLNYREYLIIGISVKLGSYFKLLEAIDLIRNENKSCMIVLGDMTPTFAFEHILKLFPNVICVIGEGEDSFVKLIDEYLAYKSISIPLHILNEVPNLAFNYNGHIVQTFRECVDLTKQPHPVRPFTNWIIENKGIIRLEASRGCPYSKCEFCCIASKYGAKNWRPYPIDYILEELISLTKEGVGSPYFTDEDFFGNDFLRSEKLAKSIIALKKEKLINPSMNFYFCVRVSDVIKADKINLLNIWKNAGLREVFIGLESGSTEQLKRYGKATTIDTNKLAIQLLKKYNIQLDIGFILFDPEMKFEEIKINLRYIEKLGLSTHDSRSLKALRIQPGTEIQQRYKSLNMISSDLDINSLTYHVDFIDKKVELVYRMFARWEELHKEKIYNLQARSRGEVENEYYRLDEKALLETIRTIDAQAMKRIVKGISQQDSQENITKNLLELADEKSKILARQLGV